MVFNMSQSALDALVANCSRVFQPAASSSGTTLVSQELAGMVNPESPNYTASSLDVKLLNFFCDSLPTNRQRTTTIGETRITSVNPDSMQQTGTAVLQIGNEEYTMKLHVPVAATLAKAGGTGTLRFSVGKISSGKNEGKYWVSASISDCLEGTALKDAVLALMHTTATQPTVA